MRNQFPGVRKKSLLWAGVCLLGLALILRLVPVKPLQPSFSTILEDRQGILLGAKTAGDGQWRFPPSDSVPDKFRKALLAFEDRYFYYHPGINPFSLLRAARQNIARGRIRSGGSTLSMQVARFTLGHRSRTWTNKLLEVCYALRLESHFSKNAILRKYASGAPFGGNVVGLAAASWRYFGKDQHALSWAEAATLAVLPNAPALIHPAKNRGKLLVKRNRLLLKLRDIGYLSPEDCERALLEPIPSRPYPMPGLAPHLLARAAKEHPGTRVRSTLDLHLQERVAAVLRTHQKLLTANYIHNMAAVVLRVSDGACLVYAGNVKEAGADHQCDVDVILAPRSTGSILKPILYAALLHQGDILPGTLVPDIPTQIGAFSPKNYNLSYDGAVPASRALARSLNVPAVKMLQIYGVEAFYQLLRKLGMTSLVFPSSHYGLSLILGGAEGKLWEMCGLYASLARSLTSAPVEKKQAGSLVFPPIYLMPHEPAHTAGSGNPGMAALPGTASVCLMFEALLEVNKPEQESGWDHYTGKSKWAWKTGTSFGYRDAWAIATNPGYVAGVWAGNADGEGRPGLTGIGAAAPALFEILSLLPEQEWFSLPAGAMAGVRVCPLSGHLAGPDCPAADSILVPLRGQHSVPCPYHRIVHLDATGRYRVNARCEPLSSIRHESWFILPPAQEFYFRSRNPFYRLLPPLKPGCQEDGSLQMIELVNLRDVSKVYIPYELDGSPGRLVLEAAHREPGALLYWHLDETYLGTTSHKHQMSLKPLPGSHRLLITDDRGNSFVKRLEILDQQTD